MAATPVGLNRSQSGAAGRLRSKLCHFSCPGQGFGPPASRALVQGKPQDGRVANDLRHSVEYSASTSRGSVMVQSLRTASGHVRRLRSTAPVRPKRPGQGTLGASPLFDRETNPPVFSPYGRPTHTKTTSPSGTIPMPDLQLTDAGADISADQKYRYSLWRSWDPSAGTCLFLMLNPSTADANNDDPTIAKCIRYAKSWGYGTLLVGNLFAFRAADKQVMKRQTDPVGPRNDESLLRLIQRANITIAAWGTDGGHLGRARAVLDILEPFGEIHCLRRNMNGTPGHPLYLPEHLRPVLFVG